MENFQPKTYSEIQINHKKWVVCDKWLRIALAVTVLNILLRLH